jgi:uncharacterized protein (TIGR01244 family)
MGTPRTLAPRCSLAFALGLSLAPGLALVACRYDPDRVEQQAAPAVAEAAPVAAAPDAPTAVAPHATDPAALLPNGKEPLPGVITGGQPSREQLEALAAAGYRTLVNLRTEREEMPVAPADVAMLGMRYVHIPVAGAADLTAAKAAELAALLADPEARPMAIHCASGNRVGALLAVEAATVEAREPEEALELGRAAGLGGLEPAVREVLGLSPASP